MTKDGPCDCDQDRQIPPVSGSGSLREALDEYLGTPSSGVAPQLGGHAVISEPPGSASPNAEADSMSDLLAGIGEDASVPHRLDGLWQLLRDNPGLSVTFWYRPLGDSPK